MSRVQPLFIIGLLSDTPIDRGCWGLEDPYLLRLPLIVILGLKKFI
jgi:hypothetical protein